MRWWHALLVWLIGSLIAIAVIGENLYLGLGIAIASGAAFGIVNYLCFQNRK
jgi:hypothetical protein